MERNCLYLKKTPQRIREFIDSKNGLPSDSVTALGCQDGRLFVGTDSGLCIIEGDTYKVNPVIEAVRSLLVTKTVVFASDNDKVYLLRDGEIQSEQLFPEPIQAICENTDGAVHLLTTRMHYIFHDDSFEEVNETEFPVHTACACGENGLYAAGAEALMILHGKRPMWGNILRGRSNMPDTDINCLSADAYGHIFCGCTDGLYLFDGRSEWISHKNVELFPSCEITALLLGADSTRYIGTAIGLYIQTATGNSFLGARRWLPDDAVTALAEDGSGGLYVGTKKGISHITYKMMSLAEKAEHYESLIPKYFTREGFVISRHLTEAENPESGSVGITDNDGLWTSMYVAAEALRYAVTGEEEALLRARTAEKAMLHLEHITGIPGFTARAYRRPGEDAYGNGHEEWHHTSDAAGDLEWRGETSSDEMVGHYFAAAWYYDLCADEEEKHEIASSIAAITDHMLQNDFMLCDKDGLPTTWAHWGPYELNHDDKWIWEKGVNSLEFLAFLLTTWHMTGDMKYYTHYRALVEKHHYAMNVISYKIHDNHACHIDDKLGFYSTLLAMRYETDPALLKFYALGLRNHYENQRIEHNPTWNVIFGALTGSFCDIENAMETLQKFPLDLLVYQTDNTNRPDMLQDSSPLCFGGSVQAKYAIPADERVLDHLGYNAFRLKGGDGKRMREPSTWLLPYWMARYYKLIKEA